METHNLRHETLVIADICLLSCHLSPRRKISKEIESNEQQVYDGCHDCKNIGDHGAQCSDLNIVY